MHLSHDNITYHKLLSSVGQVSIYGNTVTFLSVPYAANKLLQRHYVLATCLQCACHVCAGLTFD